MFSSIDDDDSLRRETKSIDQPRSSTNSSGTTLPLNNTPSKVPTKTTTLSKHPKSIGKTLEKMLYQKAHMKKNDKILQNDKSSNMVLII